MVTTHHAEINGVNVKYQKIREEEHYVFYCLKDFQDYYTNAGLSVPKVVEDWRDAQLHDWTIADDGGVVQILYKSKLKHPRDWTYKESGKRWSEKGWCRTIVGSFICKEKYEMDTNFEKHPNRYTFSLSGISGTKAVNDREKPTKNELIFAMIVSKGIRNASELAKIYMEVFKTNNESIAKTKAFALLRQDRIMRIVTEEVKNKAQELGITPEFVLSGVKSLAESANREDVRLNALEKCGEYIEMEKEVANPGNNNGLIGAFGAISQQMIGGSETKELLGESFASEVKSVAPVSTDTTIKKIDAKVEISDEKEVNAENLDEHLRKLGYDIN